MSVLAGSHRIRSSPISAGKIQFANAEMSSGVLALIHTQHLVPKVSMLVIGMNAEFHKKAIGKIRFECNDGEKINQVVKGVIQNQIGMVCETHSKGYDEQGDCVAEFFIKWSFRQKTK